MPGNITSEDLERDRIVSRYLEAMSLEGFLKECNLDLKDINVIKKRGRYAVGTLYSTQSRVTPGIIDKVREGIWNAESNRFFKEGEKVDLLHEPIILVYGSDFRPYVAVGHSRVREVAYSEGLDSKIPLFDVQPHPNISAYINNAVGSFSQKVIYLK